MSGRFGADYATDDERSSYYGRASIPFIWESRPGTPKNHLCRDSSLSVPLTPPPSYYSSEVMSTPKRQSKVRSKLSKFLSMSMFNDLRRGNHGSKKTTSSSFSWSSTTSSSSSFSSPLHSLKRGSHDKKSPLLYANYQEDELKSSPTSTLCYSNGGRVGCSSSMGSLKRVLFSGSMEKRHGTTGKALIIGDMNKA